MIRPLDWDSAHFGCRVGRVEGQVPEVDTDFDCLYFLADHHNRPAHEICRQLGFAEISERVCLLSCDLAAVPCAGIREARLEDIDSLAAIQFPDSRFWRDPHFSRERVAALYRGWIERLFESTFVAIDNDQVAGYVACAEEDHRMRVSLIAVAEEFRGRGVAAKLLNRARLLASQRAVTGLTVTTQGSNEAALRLYRRNGFREVSRETWFHWWRP